MLAPSIVTSLFTCGFSLVEVEPDPEEDELEAGVFVQATLVKLMSKIIRLHKIRLNFFIVTPFDNTFFSATKKCRPKTERHRKNVRSRFVATQLITNV